MSVFRKPSSPYWYCRFEINGREFYRSTKRTKKRDAEQVEARKRAEVLATQGTAGAPASLTLDQVNGVYWRHVENLPDAKNAELHLKVWLDELGKTTRAHELGNADIAAAVSRLRATRSDSTVNRYLGHLRAALNHAGDAYDAAMPRINWRAHRLKEPDERDVWLRATDLPALLAAAAPHLRPLILFAVYTGIRRTNQATLDWRQIDLEAGVMRLIQKGERRQLVYLSAPAIALLQTLGPKPSGRVFTYTSNKKSAVPREFKGWATAWRRAKARAADADPKNPNPAINEIRWHDLRHTFGTWARQSGADLKLLKSAMGHASIKTTARYAHHGEEELAALVERVAERAHPDAQNDAAAAQETGQNPGTDHTAAG